MTPGDILEEALDGNQKPEDGVAEVELRSRAWFDGEFEEDVTASFKDYDITSSPNDFNIKTIVDFVASGAVKIPGFQRNYVWDIKRASRLVESILIGLPIPQIFLYEQGKNSFLVVDGQQRLMSIYYFVKGVFPKLEKRPQLRHMMDEKGVLPPAILADSVYFSKFDLSLRSKSTVPASRFNGKNYDTLGEDRLSFDLRVIRNVVIKQTSPKEDQDTSVYEIFSRLNTGGVNLYLQEIRSSLYHSELFKALHRVNVLPQWRALIGLPNPDLHDKDVEILLRVFALVADASNYAEPMSGFLNQFARKSRSLSPEKLVYMESLFQAFFRQVSTLPLGSFNVAASRRFNIAIFEAVFRAVCSRAFESQTLELTPLSLERLQALKEDGAFILATQQGIGRALYVRQRYERAVAVLAS